MASPVKPIPDGFATVAPNLIVADASSALAFYARAFGAIERRRLTTREGKIWFSVMQIGESRFLVMDEIPHWRYVGPKTLGSTPVPLCLYVEDVDAWAARALAAGAKLTREVKDMFYGDRNGILEDPFGHLWLLCTHVQDLTEDELQRRGEAYDWS